MLELGAAASAAGAEASTLAAGRVPVWWRTSCGVLPGEE